MFIEKLTITNDKFSKEVYQEYLIKFQELKKKLNITKNKLDKIPIKTYTKVLNANNPYYEVSQILKKELNNPNITNAYIKLRELIVYYGELLDFSKCTHVAEAPGTFIICTSDYCNEKKKEHDWYANSYLEFQNKKSFYLSDHFGLIKRFHNKWLFGSFNNGDITRLENLRSIKQDLLDYNTSFLTGDAKVVLFKENTDLPDYENEERDNNLVIYSETLFALVLLKMGGSSIIKMFTFMEPKMIYTIYNIYRYFDEVYITKPLTSRPANNEIYLICLRKNKIFDDNEFFVIKDYPFIEFPNDLIVPDEFIKLLYTIQSDLVKIQIENLEKNIKLQIVPYDKNIITDWVKKNFSNININNLGLTFPISSVNGVNDDNSSNVQ